MISEDDGETWTPADVIWTPFPETTVLDSNDFAFQLDKLLEKDKTYKLQLVVVGGLKEGNSNILTYTGK